MKIRFAALLTALAATISPGVALGQPVSGKYGGTGCSAPTTVSGLASYEVAGTLCQVNDGLSATDCETGGGSTTTLCCYDGADWVACGGGGSSSGDVEAVGDCTTAACFDGTTGNSIMFEGSSADGNETTLTSVNPTADNTILLPNESGTLCTNSVVCSNYSGTSHTHMLGDDTDVGWFTTVSGSNNLWFEGTTDNTYEGLLTGGEFTADRTLTLPDETGTFCTTVSTATGCGNILHGSTSTNNAIVAWTGTGGKTVENTECTMNDIDGDGTNDWVSCPEGFESGDQGCVNNADCNFISIQKNDGGGTPTCATMVTGDPNLTSQLFILPKSTDAVVLCNGSTEVGTVAATSSGDVSAVGPGCASGACFTDTVTTTGTSVIVWEGTTSDAFEYTLAVPAADPGASNTWTFPATTGEIGIFPASCTGTADYVDGAGNCDTINGAEDLETATDDAVIVGNGTTFDTKALTDADAPSTTVAGTTIHYDTATNTFSAAAVPTVDMWVPLGIFSSTSTADYPGGSSAQDTCSCMKLPVTQAVADIDDVSVRISPASDANDLLEVGVYSEDGATQYFECDLLEGGTENAEVNCDGGTVTANGKILQPGDYWVCFGADADGSYAFSSFNANGNIAFQHCKFTQACSGGELPNSLTAPSCTITDESMPWIFFRNE